MLPEPAGVMGMRRSCAEQLDLPAATVSTEIVSSWGGGGGEGLEHVRCDVEAQQIVGRTQNDRWLVLLVSGDCYPW